MSEERGKTCIVDGSHGIYVGQVFAHRFGHLIPDPDDTGILLNGPEDDDYWETWDDVLDTFTVKKGNETYRLEQDGDLFLVLEEE